jgi:hypothetical protein
MRLPELGCGRDADSQVPEALGDLQRAGARRNRLVRFPEQSLDVPDECVDLAAPAVVVQPFAEGLGLAQAP